MFGKDKGPKLVGAKEKILKAQKFKKGMTPDQIDTKGEGKKPWGPTVALIFVLSVALAFTLQVGALKNTGLQWHIGMPGLDKILFSGGVPSVTGNADEDTIIVPIVRGIFIFLAGGFLPVMTLLWIRAIDRPKMNPFLAFWGVSVGLFFVYFFVRDFFGPLLMQTLGVISPGK